MSLTQITEVVVGILMNADGEFLFAQRPQGKAMAGYWEFAGGKVEAGETHFAALARELHEELGISISAATPWRSIEYHYPHAHVRLHFLLVTAWSGELVGREAQALCWQALHIAATGQVATPLTEPVLPATVPLLPDLVRWVQALPASIEVSL